MATRRLEVEFIGDTKSLDRAFKKVDQRTKGAGGGFKALAGSAKLLAGGAALGGLAVGAKKATDAFYESQKVSKQTHAVLKSTGGAAKVSAKHVGDLATALSKKTGIDDEAIQSGENLLLTFTKIRNETGKGNKIFDRSTKVITDMSAALGQDMKSSAIQVGKALNDPVKGVTALQRVGVSFTEKQKEQIKGLVEHGKTLKAQKLILKELNTEFGGSAAAQATNMDRLKVTLGNLQESVGSVFVPLMEKAFGGLNKFVDGMMSGTGAGGRLIQILKDAGQVLSGAFSSAVKFAGGLLEKHRDDLRNVRDAIANVGRAVKWAWENVALPVVKRILPAIKQIVKGTFDVIGGIIKTISSLLTGRFGDAWDGVKQIFRGAIQIVLGYVRAATAPLREAAAKVGSAIGSAFSGAWDKIKGAFRNLMGWFGDRLDDLKDLAHDAAEPFIEAFKKIGDQVKRVVGWLDKVIGLVKDVIDFLGKIKVPHIDLPDLNPLHIGGSGNGKTVGPLGNFSNVQAIADASLGWGLSGGRGPGQGNRPGDDGWHGQNRARDLSGPAGAMLAFAKALAASPVAGKLLELIYTPLGFGIKNGQFVSNSFWGADVLRDHFDHVHVAMRKGGKVPGSGVGDRVPALLEPGEFVIRKKIVDRFGPTFFAGMNGMRDGGIVDAARAAKAAGWRGQNLVRAVAIAGAESNYNRRAHALTSREDSRGPWQVNVRAHPWARRLNLYNWGVSAGAAHKVWEQAGHSFSPWSTWPGKASAYMSRARKAVASLGGGKGGKGKGGKLGVKLGPMIEEPPPPLHIEGDNMLLDGGGAGGTSSGGDNSAAIMALVDEMRRTREANAYMINTQGPQIVDAVVAAVNGGIGGRVGLGFQGIRSAPGSVAGL